MMGSLNVHTSISDEELPKVGATSILVNSACASGDCEYERGNICDLPFEWRLNRCNSNGLLPCEVDPEGEVDPE